MILLKEYEIKDWSEIKDPMEQFVPLEPMEKFLELTKQGVGITGVEDGEVMACGGVFYVNDTDGMVWLKVSKKCLENGYGWARTMRETFRLMIKATGLNIHTYILKDFCRGEKLARLIGLKNSGIETEYDGNKYNKFVAVI